MSMKSHNDNSHQSVKTKQGKQNRQVNQTSNANKDKIEYLHKMLDHQLQTVSSLFQKDNAFDQIQAKLKMLEVKLSSIKDESKPINPQNLQPNQNQYANDLKRGSLSGPSNRNQKLTVSKCVSELPFQSLSKYKQEKLANNRKQNTFQKSKTKIASKESFELSHSGKKLNFEINEQNKEQERQTIKGKKMRESSSKKFMSNKIKSETILHREIKRQRSIKSKLSTDKKQHKSSMKTISRQNSATKKRISISKTDKKERETSQKKIGESKTSTHLRSWKEIAKIYGSTKQKYEDTEAEKKQKVKQIIRKSEAKRLQKQLKDYRAKNEALQHQVSQLKSYKTEFEKLKTIFEKDERLRKSRKLI